MRAFTEQKPAYIADWGLSMTTIEDVFLHIVRRDEEEAAKEDVAKQSAAAAAAAAPASKSVASV